MDTTRYFGVEIECSDVETDHYANWYMHWEHCGYEFVSPLLSGDNGLASIVSLYNAIRPRVNHRCGLHVHVDVRDLSPDERLALVRKLKANKHVFFGKVDESRHNNVYCCGDIPDVHANDTWLSYYRRVLHNDRYCWVNLHAVTEHGSVEFRLHEATENVEEVIEWVTFLVEFVESVKGVMEPVEPTSFPSIFAPLDVSTVTINGIIDRMVSTL